MLPSRASSEFGNLAPRNRQGRALARVASGGTGRRGFRLGRIGHLVTFSAIVIKRSDDGKCGQKSQLPLRVYGPGVITDMATDQLLVPQRFGADQLGQRRSWLGHFSGGIPQRRPVGDLVPQVGQPQQRNHCRRGRPS
jgi:hypothetical protein